MKRLMEIADNSLLDAVLDAWDRNNTILVNLLRALPPGALQLKAATAGPTVAEMLTHIHYVRLVLVSENAPEFGTIMPDAEWSNEGDPDRIAHLLNESAGVVREAIRGRIQSGRAMERHYAHPILLMQHLVWHEGYHHGQIKLVLKAAGQTLNDNEVGPVTWNVWMRKG